MAEGLSMITQNKGADTPINHCGDPSCKNKVVLVISMNKTIMFPVCREHLEKLYKKGFFDEIKDLNYLKMVEGIIQYGSLEEWLDKKDAKDGTEVKR